MLTVHGLAGRRVALLADKWLQAGPHEATWNGRDSQGRTASAGQYLVRLKTADATDVRKVILAK